jgi:hypothetical protein
MRTLEAKREPAFNVGQFQIFHVKSMFGNIGERLLHACIVFLVLYPKFNK